MPPSKGGAQTLLHFRSESVQQAIALLEERYPNQPGKTDKNKSFLKLFQLEVNAANADELLELGLGKSIIADDGIEGFEIGLVGKIWALLSLVPLCKVLQSRAGKKPMTAAYAILGNRVEPSDALRLSFLIKLTTTDYSNPENKQQIRPKDLTRYYDLVKKFAAKCLKSAGLFSTEGGAVAQIESLIDQSFSSPAACGRHLYEALELQGCVGGPSPELERQGPTHDFEPVLQQFIDNEIALEREKDHDIEAAINKVMRRLERYRSDPNRPHIALLLGDEQSGKKSVVGDLLRLLRAECVPGAPITLPVRYASRAKLRLPILAMSVRNHDYGSLCAYVLAFLRRANGHIGRDVDLQTHARLLKQQHVKGGSLDEILSLIEMEHDKRPALFIFLDAQGLDRDSLDRVLQNSGLYRLLRRLWQSNVQSRYIITTSAVDHAYAPRELALGRAIIKVPRPKIDRFAWYLSSQDLKRYRQPDDELLSTDGQPQTLEDALNTYASSLQEDLQVSGDVLLSMSALYATGVSNKTFFDVCMLYLSDQEEPGAEGKHEGRTQIYEALIDAFDDLGILLPISLIAATRFTEDVLTTSSLRELCRRYSTSSTEEEFTKYWDATISRLETVAEGARTLFLSRYQQVRTDPDELGYREERQERGSNWYMSSAVATSLLKVLMADPEHHELAKDAFRLIATAARRRAQLKRMRRSDDASSSDRGEIARDIQCFVALLASLPQDQSIYESGGFGSETNRALRLSLDEVFTVTKDFNPVHALRFAVQCVLRQDIDEGYRLSMVTDQDELRLRLYLLIFFPVGQLHTWTITHLRDLGPEVADFLPETMPWHVTSLFDAETRLDLLLTVALAAYHSQLPHIVTWALKMSEHIECVQEDSERQRRIAMRARIAGTAIDAGIASGKNVVGTGNLGDVLNWTMEQSEPIISEIGFDPLEEGADVASLLPRNLKLVQSRMRLGAREAELKWIAKDDLKTARKIYDRLERLEHLIARHIDQSEPVVMSGRTARRFARLLCRDYPVFAEPWFSDEIRPMPASVTRKVRHVIEANIGRLNHFAGADRIGVLVDQARRHCIAKDFELAREYIRDAFRRLESSKISHGGRLDLLGVKAGIHLALGEMALQRSEPVAPHLDAANTQIKSLASVSDSLEYDCPRVVGEFLKARAKILENAAKGDALLANKADKTLDKCIRSAKKSGYKSAESIARIWKEKATK